MALLCVIGGAVAIGTQHVTATLLAAALVLFFAFAAFVPFKPWGWTLALVAIGLGLAGGSALFAIPLLLAWFKPTVKAAFARL